MVLFWNIEIHVVCGTCVLYYLVSLRVTVCKPQELKSYYQ